MKKCLMLLVFIGCNLQGMESDISPKASSTTVKSNSPYILTRKRTGSQLMGCVAVSNKRQSFTALRSPNIDIKSREQFELITHKRSIILS